MIRPLEDVPETGMVTASPFSPTGITQHHLCLTTPFTACLAQSSNQTFFLNQLMTVHNMFSTISVSSLISRRGFDWLLIQRSMFYFSLLHLQIGPIAGNSLAEYYRCGRLYFTVVAKDSDSTWQLQFCSTLRWR